MSLTAFDTYVHVKLDSQNLTTELKNARRKFCCLWRCERDVLRVQHRMLHWPDAHQAVLQRLFIASSGRRGVGWKDRIAVADRRWNYSCTCCPVFVLREVRRCRRLGLFKRASVHSVFGVHSSFLCLVRILCFSWHHGILRATISRPGMAV